MTVLLVEAGYDQESNDIVYNTGNYQKAFNVSIRVSPLDGLGLTYAADGTRLGIQDRPSEER